MSTKQQISQGQGQRQQLRLSQQQLMVAGLLEGSIVELEEKVKREVESNPALEEYSPDDSYEPVASDDMDTNMSGVSDIQGTPDSIEDGVYVDVDERADDYSGSYGNSSELPEDYNSAYAEYEGLTDYLNSQLESIAQTPKEIAVGRYIIGSLDDDGFLKDSLSKITDDINIYGGIEVTISDVVSAVSMVQSLDPAGVGARTIQECLRLQAERSMTGNFRADFIARCAVAVLDEAFEELTKKRYDSMLRKVEVECDKEGEFSSISRDELIDAIAFIRSLNPHPCQIFTDTKYLRGTDSIIPDFSYDSESEKLTVNNGRIPNLSVNAEYQRMLDDIEKKKAEGTIVRDDSEVFLRDRINSANMFIEALDQRKSIMTKVMTAIVNVQKEFFRQGCDDSLLKPLTMKQIAETVGCDISTVSRVAGSKYVIVDGHYTFKLKHFFSEKISTESGDSVSNKSIMEIIKTLVSEEDKSDPLTDDAIAAVLKSKGYNVARRTVAKYRGSMDIPSTRERREV